MEELLARIATIIADYREGEIERRTPEHVRRWVGQFDEAVREPLLRELAHVLDRTYLRRQDYEAFVGAILRDPALTGGDPVAFWRGVQFLEIQQGGRSQADILELFRQRLADDFGIAGLPVGPSQVFVYLDDISFSGNRALTDLREWMGGSPPPTGRVHVIMMASHRAGEWYALDRLRKEATRLQRDVTFTWRAVRAIEDRPFNLTTADVLRPKALPTDDAVARYRASMKHAPVFRVLDSVGARGFYSSGEQRHFFEQEMLRAGCRVRELCPYLKTLHRPLGYMKLDTLGFGAMTITHRNCPNNAPLALWAGDPWIPLFPRRTN